MSTKPLPPWSPPVIFPDLDTYIAKTGDTQVAIAAVTGTTQATISRIREGEQVPQAHLALRIANYARIPLDSFMRVYLAKHPFEDADDEVAS